MEKKVLTCPNSRHEEIDKSSQAPEQVMLKEVLP